MNINQLAKALYYEYNHKLWEILSFNRLPKYIKDEYRYVARNLLIEDAYTSLEQIKSIPDEKR